MKNQIKLSEIKKSIEIGSHDEGSWGSPGSQGYTAEVAFLLISNGEFRARINTEYGSNQGYHEINGGSVERIDCATLDEAIDRATEYCESIDDNTEIVRSLRLAANEARNWARKNQVVSDDANPLEPYSVEQLESEVESRKAKMLSAE